MGPRSDSDVLTATPTSTATATHAAAATQTATTDSDTTPSDTARSGWRSWAPEARTLIDDSEFDVRRAFQEHGSVLLGFAINALGDRHTAEDCVQETLVRAWRARERFHPERGSERTWLLAIARNVIIDAHRARARRPVQPQAEVPEQTAARSMDAEVVDRVTLMSGLAQLSREHRQVVVAVHLHGMKYEEVAEATGVPTGTLRSRMYYALRALREVVGEEIGAHGR